MVRERLEGEERMGEGKSEAGGIEGGQGGQRG